MVIKEITRSNVLDIVEFLGAAYVNLIIERHPSGKVTIQFTNSTGKVIDAHVRDHIACDNGEYSLYPPNYQM